MASVPLDWRTGIVPAMASCKERGLIGAPGRVQLHAAPASVRPAVISSRCWAAVTVHVSTVPGGGMLAGENWIRPPPYQTLPVAPPVSAPALSAAVRAVPSFHASVRLPGSSAPTVKSKKARAALSSALVGTVARSCVGAQE